MPREVKSNCTKKTMGERQTGLVRKVFGEIGYQGEDPDN